MPADTGSLGEELAFVTAGDGPALVLLHGGVGSWTHWSRNISALSGYFRVCAFDLPGFGASPSFPEGASDQAYFQRVADAIGVRNSGPVRLVGFSFGGSVAAAVAPLLGAQLVALSLVAPGGFGVPADRKVDVRPVRARDGVQIDPRSAARHNLNEVMFADPTTVDDATVDLHLQNITRARFNSRRLSWQDRLARDLLPLQVPIQFIWGERDRMATPSVDARIAKCRTMHRGLRFDVIPRAGHWVQYERPGAFDVVLLDFMRRDFDSSWSAK